MTRISDDDLAQELGRLHALAQRLAGPDGLAEDAVQDTALIALRRDRRTVRSVRAWLGAVFWSRFGRLAAREHRRNEVESRASCEPERSPSAADAAATAELHRSIADAVVALPEPHRTAVTLRFLRDLPLAEVAAATGVSAEAARTRVRRGLDLLRQRLDQERGGRHAWVGLVGLPAVDAPVTPPLPVHGTTVLTMTAKQVTIGCTVAAIAVVGLFAWRAFDDGATRRPVESDAVGTHSGEAVTDSGAREPDRTVVSAARPATALDEPPARGPSALWGRVVRTGSDDPVANARVALLVRPADEFSGMLDLAFAARVEEVATAITDGDGAFLFEVERGRPYRVRVNAAGAAELERANLVGGAEVVLRVASPAGVTGTVVDAHGEPVCDAGVTAIGSDAPEHATRTDVEGAFFFAGLHPTRVRITARDADGMIAWTLVDLEPGATRHVDLRIEAGRIVAGTVIDADTRLPVAGATVSDAWMFERIASTDARGRFELRAAGAVATLQAHAPDYATAFRSVPSAPDEDIEIPLRRGGRIRGRIVADDGELLVNPLVFLGCTQHVAGMPETDWITATVAPDGSFLAQGLDPTMRYQIAASARGKGRRLLDVPRPIEADTLFDAGVIALAAEGGIVGRVVDDRGPPVAGAVLFLRGPATKSLGDADPGSQRPEVYWFATRELRSADDGSFRIAGLAGGEYVITARHPSQSFGVDTRVNAAIRDGGSTEVEIVLAAGRRIRGRVLAPRTWTADDHARLELVAYGSDRWNHSFTRVERTGTFAFEHLRDGTYTIAAMHCVDGWHVRDVAGVRPGDTDVRLQVVPAATITGRVMGSDGEPRRAEVWARAKGNDAPMVSMQQTDTEGRFTLYVAPDFVGVVGARMPGVPLGADRREDVVAGTADLVLTLTE